MRIRVIRGQTPSNPGAEIQIHESHLSPRINRSTCRFQNHISATKSPDSCEFVSFVVNHPATPAQELTTTNHPNHPANNRRTCRFQNQISATKSPDSCKFVSFVVNHPANNRRTCGFQNQIRATRSPDSCKFVSFVVNHPATPAQELTTTNHPNHQRIVAAPAVSKTKSAQPSPLIRANSCHSWTNTQQPRRRNSDPRITPISTNQSQHLPFPKPNQRNQVP